jgi:glycosyltransferase involved in cell wall biosynthesis
MRVAPDTFWLYRAKPVLAGFGIRVEADQSEGEEARFLEAFPQLAGKRFALFLARVHPKKGVDLLVEAFIRVAHRAPDLHLVIAGPDPDHLRPALEARAREAGVAERITWTGMITGDVKWGAFKAAEVYVLPSHQENFGITAVEAMAVKTPVLLTRRVNIWREIEADGAGLAGEDTVDGITDLLERWLQLDEPARACMRENGPACYRRHFHIDTAADRLVEIVENTANPSVQID